MNPRVSRSRRWRPRPPASRSPRSPPSWPSATPWTRSPTTSPATPAAFEPTLDYVVVKIPRFAFEKFPGADPTLTTTMKSVGEAMAIGRSFAEALGKAMRSMETKAAGFWTALRRLRQRANWTRCSSRCARRPTAGSTAVERALRLGRHRRAGARGDRHRPVVPRPDRRLVGAARRRSHDAPVLTTTCCAGPSGTGCPTADRGAARPETRPARTGCARCATGSGIRPVYKTVDTCAAEFAAQHPVPLLRLRDRSGGRDARSPRRPSGPR